MCWKSQGINLLNFCYEKLFHLNTFTTNLHCAFQANRYITSVTLVGCFPLLISEHRWQVVRFSSFSSPFPVTTLGILRILEMVPLRVRKSPYHMWSYTSSAPRALMNCCRVVYSFFQAQTNKTVVWKKLRKHGREVTQTATKVLCSLSRLNRD